jgi:hypothetical protein
VRTHFIGGVFIVKFHIRILLDGNTMKIIPLFLTAAMVFASCSTCGLDTVAKTDEAKRLALHIVVGEGGGIAGRWEGHTIMGDGSVYHWKGRGAGESPQLFGRLPADTMCALWDAAISLRSPAPGDSTGSLVQMLTVTAADSTKRYAWRPNLGVGSRHEDFEVFYDRCLSALRNSTSQHK